MKHFLLILSGLIVFAALAFHAPAVSAQEPTATVAPTVTPTPSYIREYALGENASVQLERRVSYGQIAIVLAIAVLVVIQSVFALLYWGRKWVR